MKPILFEHVEYYKENKEFMSIIDKYSVEIESEVWFEDKDIVYYLQLRLPYKDDINKTVVSFGKDMGTFLDGSMCDGQYWNINDWK